MALPFARLPINGCLMHKTLISRAALELSNRAYAARSSLPLVPGRFAHVVVDLQNGFLSPDSELATQNLHLIVPNVNKISAAVRHAGGTNIFIRFTYDPKWTNRYKRVTSEFAHLMEEHFTAGCESHALWRDLDVRPDDLTLDKTRISAFTPGTCELDAQLRVRGIDTLVVTGCYSNACCESTARDAVQMNYNVVFVEDGNAAVSDSDHNGAVSDLFSIFGCDICTTDAVITRMTGVYRSTDRGHDRPDAAE